MDIFKKINDVAVQILEVERARREAVIEGTEADEKVYNLRCQKKELFKTRNKLLKERRL